MPVCLSLSIVRNTIHYSLPNSALPVQIWPISVESRAKNNTKTVSIAILSLWRGVRSHHFKKALVNLSCDFCVILSILSMSMDCIVSSKFLGINSEHLDNSPKERLQNPPLTAIETGSFLCPIVKLITRNHKNCK